MFSWIAVAVAGLALALAGIRVVFRRYRRGALRGSYLLAMIIGVSSFGSYAVVSVVWPELTTGPATIFMLLPAFVAIVLLVREHRWMSDSKQ